MLQNDLMGKLRLILKFTNNVIYWEKIITLHILPKISRNECIQGMKFGQLTEYNIRKVFLEKTYENVVKKLGLGSFLKIQN